ncbi:MAG TPA: site-specific integrase [Solirubrobacterales bacterium]|nr:site-specific integrase [Solirubrobacterales bacterium]
MATKSKGQVLERDWKSGRGYALRFTAYGERRYVSLGFKRNGWTFERAEEELANIMADVRRGIWVPPKKEKRSKKTDETSPTVPAFGPFARGLVAARRGQVSENTTSYEEWGLGHLLDYFADWPLHEIDIEAVDAYRLIKVEEAEKRRRAIANRRPIQNEHGQTLRPLSASSINKTIDLLQWVLSVALEYKHVTENPAIGRRRRLKQPQVRPVHLDTAGQIEALLDAAAEMDRNPKYLCSDRQPIVAVLVLTGPRASEVSHMLWRDVDLANGRILIGQSKTQAGLREIRMLPILRDILAAHKAFAYRSGPDDLVFPNGAGNARQKDSLRSRILLPTLAHADELLLSRGQVPLPKGITSHKLRHTFASVLIACGEDPISVMGQLGHTDPSFTLRVYSHSMSRDPGERARLKALVKGDLVAAQRSPQQSSSSLDVSVFEQTILRVLAELGGSGRRRDVLAAVGKSISSQLGEIDRERLPSGPLRWEALACKARQKLVGSGLMDAQSTRGTWELDRHRDELVPAMGNVSGASR